MKRIIIQLLLFFVCFLTLKAQKTETDSFLLLKIKNVFNFPGDSAELFAPGIISTGFFEHSSPTTSPDCKEIFWSVYLPDSLGHSRPILFIKYIDNDWTKPTIASFVKSNYRYGNPFFSADGNRIYFSATPVDEGKSNSDSSDIWYVERDGTDWSEQKKMENPPNTYKTDAQPSLSANNNLYYVSHLDAAKNKYGLFFSSFKKNRYEIPVVMDKQFNSLTSDWTPYISPDESYFIFSSFRDGGYGSGDLYISYKLPNGSWGKAINMGAKINSDANERFPNVTPDGKYLFFNSTKNISGADTNSPGNGNGDVYWIDAKVIQELKKKDIENR